ncbi:nucleotidyl transferase AbiEii/AbiGii toxin family protein [Myxococcota bacterium]|nr:nucleotidyl transferase AbiEii/AbiGii toxin family protein [Myxococcota bacterium]
MIEKVLNSKIREYAPVDAIEQENTLVEVMQHYILVGLSRTGFFEVAEFQGGTFLRIIHGLERFSEDLDFVLKRPDDKFSFEKYLGPLAKYMNAEGWDVQVADLSKEDRLVKKALIKTDAIGKAIILELPHPRDHRRHIKIKVEVDTAPPAGSVFETSYISFPSTVAITTQTLESAFASKTHALLCRPWVKGRDWFDFLWYVSHKVSLNFNLLENALNQAGPWAKTNPKPDPLWLNAKLDEAIETIDWPDAVEDVRRFLSPTAQSSLDLWSADFFKWQSREQKRILTRST